MAYQLLKKEELLQKTNKHNLHHIRSLLMELFVMSYSEAFVTLTTVKMYVLQIFFFFFDGYVTNFTIPFGVIKNRYRVCLKFWFALTSWGGLNNYGSGYCTFPPFYWITFLTKKSVYFLFVKLIYAKNH